jgi:hypothetical protein
MSTIIQACNGGCGREVANLILSIQNGEADLTLTCPHAFVRHGPEDQVNVMNHD